MLSLTLLPARRQTGSQEEELAQEIPRGQFPSQPVSGPTGVSEARSTQLAVASGLDFAAFRLILS